LINDLWNCGLFRSRGTVVEEEAEEEVEQEEETVDEEKAEVAVSDYIAMSFVVSHDHDHHDHHCCWHLAFVPCHFFRRSWKGKRKSSKMKLPNWRKARKLRRKRLKN
jgi:hypothetical protein